MRLARLGVIGFGLWAQSAQANDPTARLDWRAPAPAGSEAVVTVRAQSGQTLVTLREELGADAVTHSFVLPPLPRASYSLQAGLVSEGRVILQGPVKPVRDASGNGLATTLTHTRALVFADLWDCDTDGQWHARWTEDGLSLSQDAQQIAFEQTEAGAFSAPDGTRFQIAGNRATLAAPQRSSICAPALQPPVLPVHAYALQPEWRIAIGEDTALIDLPGLEDATLATTGLQISAPRDGTMTLRSAGLTLRLTDTTCRIGGIDLQYPISADLRSDQPELSAQGCAGNPLDFLAGQPWQVETLLGLPLDLPPGGAMTIQVSDDQISGRGTCNRYLGSAQISDGQLALRDLGTTRLSCSADLRNLELRFLDALETATGFDISPTGQLILRAGVLPVLIARRQEN